MESCSALTQARARTICGRTITRLNPVHALLYLVVSLLAVAVVFHILGAPFIAALRTMLTRTRAGERGN